MYQLEAYARGRELEQLIRTYFRSEEAALRWLHDTPVPMLQGRTVMQAIECGEIDRILDLLYALRERDFT